VKLIRELIDLNEAAAEDSAAPTLDIKSAKQIADILETHCAGSIWMLKHNTPFYRGDDSMERALAHDHYATLNSELTTRKSQNMTTNHYTVIMDNIPSRHDFPKRSKSIICTTDPLEAGNYGSKPVQIIPFDSAKVGIANTNDIWNTPISFLPNMFKFETAMNEVNSFYRHLGLEETWQDIKAFAHLLKTGDVRANKTLYKALANCSGFLFNHYLDPKQESDKETLDKIANDCSNHFIELLNNAYSPKKTGHEWHYGRDIPKDVVRRDTEVWIQGQMLVLDINVTYAKIMKAV